MMINGTNVTLDNIDGLLANITSPRRMTLTLHRVAIRLPLRPPPQAMPTEPREDLVKLISGDRLNETPLSLDAIPHGVFYLTMDVASEKMTDKVFS